MNLVIRREAALSRNFTHSAKGRTGSVLLAPAGNLRVRLRSGPGCAVDRRGLFPELAGVI